MKDSELDAIRERAASAAWYTDSSYGKQVMGVDVPALLAEVEKLRGDAENWRRLTSAITPANQRCVQWPRDRADVVTSSALRGDTILLLRRVANGEIIYIRSHSQDVAVLVPASLLPAPKTAEPDSRLLHSREGLTNG